MATADSGSFWKTTGVMSLAVAVIGAIGTIVAQQLGNPEPPPSSTTAAPPPASPVTGQQPPVNPTSATQVPAPPATPLWTGHFNMQSYVSFEVLPPENEAVSKGGHLSQDTAGNFWVEGRGALWESPTAPSRQECLDRIAGYAVDKIHAEIGRQMCYKTRSGRVVHVRFTELVQPGNVLNTPLWGTEVTVWPS